MAPSAVETAWTYLYKDVFHENEFMFYIIGSYAILNSLFWGLSAIFMFVDVTGRPAWMLRYKIQPGVNQPLDTAKLRHVMRVVFVNLTFVSVPYLVLMYPRVGTARPQDLPTPLSVLGHVLVSAALGEVWFYYSHRLGHWPPVYKRFHKQHHEWTAPFGLASAYCHPVEQIAVNMAAFSAGPLVLRSHVFTTWIWFAIGIIVTIVNHSNYHLPFLTSPEAHDFHHLKFNVNYGSAIGFMDWLHGTNKMFKERVEHKRHRILVGVQPMRERYPDPKADKAE